jgi:hypothetical protein
MSNKIKRRNFIGTSAKGVAAAGLLTAASCANIQTGSLENVFVHHVYFWLKEPVTKENRTKFENALKELVKVETIVDKHLGVPASTSRDVIDGSYSYSLLVTFKNLEDQQIYQTHPIHLKFIADCEDLWERVVVYDSVSI